MEFEGRGRQPGPDGFGMPARFMADSPVLARAEVDIRDPARAIALLGELGSKVTEESLVLMPVLLRLLKHDAATVVRKSVVNGTRLLCNVLEEIAIQLHQVGKMARWLEEIWVWMVKFKDAVVRIAKESGSVSVRALALKFLEVYILLFTSDMNEFEISFTEGKTKGFNISEVIGVHPIFEQTLISSEMSKCLGLLLDLLQSPNTFPGSLTVVVINCLSTIARKKPVYYIQILSALLAFDPDSKIKETNHVSSMRYSLKTAFIGFLKCIHHPFITESRDKLIRALRTLHPGEATEQSIRQIDKMCRNAEQLSRDGSSSKDDETSSPMSILDDTIPKRSNDGVSILDDVLAKRSRYSVPLSSSATASLVNNSARDGDDDDEDGDLDTENGLSHNGSLGDGGMTPVEQVTVMIGALLAQGERGAQSLEILVSQMQADLLADIVMFNMKNLPESELLLSSTHGSYAPQTPSSDSPVQIGPSTSSSATADASAIQSLTLPAPLGVAVSSTLPTEVPSFPIPPADAKRDPRRDPRRLDPRRITSPVGAQPIALNLESSNDVHSGHDDSSSKQALVHSSVKADDNMLPSAFKTEMVTTESSLPLSSDATTVHESPVLMDHSMEKEPSLAVEEASEVPLSPINVDQDMEPCTSSEAIGNDGVDILTLEADKHSLSNSNPLMAEKDIHELPVLPLFVDLADEETKLMSKLAVSRIAESYKQIQAMGCIHARLCLLARLVSQVDADTVVMLQKLIIKDYHHKKGHELVIYILYYLHSIMLSGAEECHASASGIYEKFLLAIAKSMCNILPASDKSFSRLLNEAPLLPESALNLLEDLCHSSVYNQHGKDARESDRVTQGLGAVWSLILVRPHTRQACTRIALKCAVDAQDEVRGKAIRLVANKLYSLSYVMESIEQYAKSMILSLMDQQPADRAAMDGTSTEHTLEVNHKMVEPTSRKVSAISFSQAQQYSSLFFALCIKKPSLLKLVFDVYGRAPKALKQSIHWHVPELVKKLGASCPELLHIVSDFSEGSENLLMLVLQIMTEEMTPPADLIVTVRHLYQTKFKDAIILIPILSSLSKDEVLPIFPQLVDLPIEKFQMALARILQGSAHTGPALTPAEVLIAIHDINPEKDGVTLKKIMDACNTCFEQKTVFTQHVLIKALNELIERTPLPLLFMRTVIQAIDAFPTLVDLVMEILSKLVARQIWKLPKLWAGFLKCAAQTQPHSFNVLLQLPPAQLESVLQKHANLKVPLAAYVNQRNLKNSLSRQALEVLGLISE